MTTPASVKVLKRHRSFSNTRDKDSNKVCSKLICFNSHQNGLAHSKLRRIIDDIFLFHRRKLQKARRKRRKAWATAQSQKKMSDRTRFLFFKLIKGSSMNNVTNFLTYFSTPSF